MDLGDVKTAIDIIKAKTELDKLFIVLEEKVREGIIESEGLSVDNVINGLYYTYKDDYANKEMLVIKFSLNGNEFKIEEKINSNTKIGMDKELLYEKLVKAVATKIATGIVENLPRKDNTVVKF